MKGSLLHKYKLEKKVAKLEKLVLERSVGRGGGPSKAYQIWDYLMNNGPQSISDLKSALPKEVTNFINFYADNNLLNKDGNIVSANADYKWDDIGVIPRTAQQELMNSIRNGGALSAVQEEPPTRSQRAPRQRAVKQNLFSRKFDEVKAAIDAGQDVNQINDKGQTPLLFAANSKAGNNSDIIEYLLTRGANLNNEFRGFNAFELACKNSNIDAMKVILENDTQGVISKPSLIIRQYYKDVPNSKDVILLAASKEKDIFNSDLHRFYYSAYALKIISKEQYEQVIGTILNNCRYSSCSSESIACEVTDKITNTIRKIADKKNILVNLYFAVFNNEVSVSTARQLLDICGEVANGKLLLSTSYRADDFIDTCRMLCNKVDDKSFMSNLLNPKFLSNLDDGDLLSIFYDAVGRENVDTLSKLVAAKVKLRASAVCGNTRVLGANKEITRLATRLIDKSTTLGRWDIDSVARCKNEYLINYVIDMGYGEDLLAWCANNANNLNDGMAVVKALKENGFELPDDEDSKKNIISAANSKKDIKDNISNIIDAIKNDTWDRRLEKVVTDHPEILLNDSITKAIEDNNTTTSRQLRRRIERMPKDQDVYDL